MNVLIRFQIGTQKIKYGNKFLKTNNCFLKIWILKYLLLSQHVAQKQIKRHWLKKYKNLVIYLAILPNFDLLGS